MAGRPWFSSSRNSEAISFKSQQFNPLSLNRVANTLCLIPWHLNQRKISQFYHAGFGFCDSIRHSSNIMFYEVCMPISSPVMKNFDLYAKHSIELSYHHLQHNSWIKHNLLLSKQFCNPCTICLYQLISITSPDSIFLSLHSLKFLPQFQKHQPCPIVNHKHLPVPVS